MIRLVTSLLFSLLFLGCTHAAPLDDQPVESGGTVQAKGNNRLPTFWIIGDSTVKVGTPGQVGWGDAIAPFFDQSKINIVNRAIGGRSSRTFLTDGRWDAILKDLKPGDVVIMQFGHNDSSPINEDPPITKATRARGTIKGNGEETVDIINIFSGKPETVHSYGWYLRNYVTTAKAKGAVAIVCSPIPRKSWTDDGTVRRASGDYGAWAREAAASSGALFVDLNEIIARAYERIGKDAVEPLFADRGTHTSAEGAAFNAKAVVSGLNGLKPNPLAFAESSEGRAVPAFQP